MGEDLSVARLRGLVMRKRTRSGTDCGSTNTLAIHPFKSVEEYKQCIFGNLEVFSKTAFSVLT